MENNMMVIGLIVLVLVIMGIGKARGGSGSGYKRMKMGEAAALMKEMDKEKTKYTILDVRTPAEFKRGHIPNAVNIANETIGSGKISRLPDMDKTIFVYCQSGGRSSQSARKLAKLGYTNVIEMGGIGGWPGKLAK